MSLKPETIRLRASVTVVMLAVAVAVIAVASIWHDESRAREFSSTTHLDLRLPRA
jgi:hypothetical protein